MWENFVWNVFSNIKNLSEASQYFITNVVRKIQKWSIWVSRKSTICLSVHCNPDSGISNARIMMDIAKANRTSINICTRNKGISTLDSEFAERVLLVFVIWYSQEWFIMCIIYLLYRVKFKVKCCRIYSHTAQMITLSYGVYFDPMVLFTWFNHNN